MSQIPMRQWYNTCVEYTYMMEWLSDMLRDQQVIWFQFAEEDNTSNRYATYDEEMVKTFLIIDPGHDVNAT